MEHELWKPIPGYEKDYEVSSIGNVRSLRFANKGEGKKGIGIRNLKPILSSHGYYVVNLHKNGHMKQFLVHRLVAQAFIPNPHNYQVIDHIDTITTNNNIGNLRWCTPKDNVNNPISSKRRIEKCKRIFQGKFGKDSFVHREVLQYTLDGIFIKEWECMSDAWKSLGIDSGSITKACKGIQKSAGGYIWKYKNQK